MQHLIKPTNPPLNACKIFTYAAAENIYHFVYFNVDTNVKSVLALLI